MKLIRFVAKNWLALKDVEYIFEDGAKQIKGKNLCETDSQDSNGSGKSSFVEGITKCLLNYTSRKEVDKNLVNFNSDEAYLYLEILCPFRDETMIIERKFKKKGSSEAQLSIRGKIVHAFEDKMVKEINKEILEWMGMNEDDLMNYYFISKDKFKSFFSSSNTDKLTLINRFSNLSILDNVKGNIKSDSDTKESEINKENEKIYTLRGKLELLQEQLEKEKSVDIKKEIKDKITELETINEENLQSIEELNGELSGFSDKINYLSSNIKVYESKQVFTKLSSYFEASIASKQKEIEKLEQNKDKLNTKLKELQSGNKELEVALNDCYSLLNEIERNIHGSVSCPKCSFKFLVGNNKVNISEEEQRKIDVSELIKVTNGDIDKAKTLILNYTNEQIKPIDDKITLLEKELRTLKNKNSKVLSLEMLYVKFINSKKSSVESIKSEKERISTKIDAFFNEVEHNIIEIEKLANSPLKNAKIKELQTSISEVEMQIKCQEEVINKLQDELFHILKWNGVFDRFKIHIANKSIRVIQDYCNKSLIDMKSDMRVKMEGFKIKSDGKSKEEITAYIYRDGELRNFGSFSAGERARLEYSMIIAIQNVINSTNKWGGLHFLSSDEAVEGLDALGLDKVINSLQQFEFPILITSHIQSNFDLEKCIIFVKDENGSRLETDIEYLKKLFI